MPVYLCKPGWSSPEPWRHGVQVYAYPFRIDEDYALASTLRSSDDAVGRASAALQPPAVAAAANPRSQHPRRETTAGSGRGREAAAGEADAAVRRAGEDLKSPSHSSSPNATPFRTRGGDSSSTAVSAGLGVAVRRVRHAEVVLVDEVSEAHGRYWLRLRWPGPRGGVAGFIALGPVRLGEDGMGRAVKGLAGGGVGVGVNVDVDIGGSAEAMGEAFRMRTLMSGAFSRSFHRFDRLFSLPRGAHCT